MVAKTSSPQLVGKVMLQNQVVATAVAGDETPAESSAAAATAAGDGEEEDGEVWDLTKIFTVKELNKSKPKMCSHGKTEKECELVACSKWESKGQSPWFSCLDCQVE